MAAGLSRLRAHSCSRSPASRVHEPKRAQAMAACERGNAARLSRRYLTFAHDPVARSMTVGFRPSYPFMSAAGPAGTVLCSGLALFR